jgi:hypothetical protein
VASYSGRILWIVWDEPAKSVRKTSRLEDGHLDAQRRQLGHHRFQKALDAAPGRVLWREHGQTEGQITKLKLVKSQMYGRANLDLLRARLHNDVHRD